MNIFCFCSDTEAERHSRRLAVISNGTEKLGQYLGPLSTVTCKIISSFLTIIIIHFYSTFLTKIRIKALDKKVTKNVTVKTVHINMELL